MRGYQRKNEEGKLKEIDLNILPNSVRALA